MAADHRGVAVACLVLRLPIATALAVSFYFITTDMVFYYFYDGTKFKFKSMIGFRYVLAISSIGLLYTLVQIPVTFFFLFTKETMEGALRLVEFSMYGDKVISVLLAFGVGVGFYHSIHLKHFKLERDNFLVSEVRLKFDEHIRRAIVSTALLLVGAVFLVTMSIIFFSDQNQGQDLIG